MGQDISSGCGLHGRKVGGSSFTSRSKCQTSLGSGRAAIESSRTRCVHLPSREGSRDRTAKNWDTDTSGSSWGISGLGSSSSRTPQLGDTALGGRCCLHPAPLWVRERVRGALSAPSAPCGSHLLYLCNAQMSRAWTQPLLGNPKSQRDPEWGR